MGGLTMGGILFLVVFLGGIFFLVGIYNRLVSLRNRFKNGFAQIDVQLKRRYDLIPNLVAVAREYIKHERETLEAVIVARNQAMGAERQAAADPGNGAALEGLMAAEGVLSGTLGRLFALAESYPDLKANQNMLQLSEELSSTENRIAFARQAFNDAVMAYNTSRELFPAVLFASIFGFQPAQFLELSEKKEREAPRVAF